VPVLLAPTTLKVFDRSLIEGGAPEPHLAWHVQFGSGAGQEYFVDARNGQILYALSLTREDGASLHGFDFDLQDAENEANAQDDDCFWTSDDVTIADEDADSFNSDYLGLDDAVMANVHARNCYAFFHDTFGLHSYDNDEAQMEVFIRTTIDPAKVASWDNGCELIQFAPGAVDFEIMVHEFTHAIIGSEIGSQLVYAAQSGALNESYADIMALVADRQAGDLNWTVGEERTGGGPPIRDFRNPSQNPALPIPNPKASWQPDSMAGFDLCAGDADCVDDKTGKGLPDKGGVHFNSGIPNKVAFLMAQNNATTFNFITVQGMGLSKMRDLKYYALLTLTMTADFAAARASEIGLAEAFLAIGDGVLLPKFTESDVCTVRNAWAAVGVGGPDIDCDGDEDDIDSDDDGLPDAFDNCPWIANPDQSNSDSDGRGDACDNCPTCPNPGQEDLDMDGIGDTCDPDIDGDGCMNATCNGTFGYDQHPYEQDVPVGSYSGPCCSGVGAIYRFEGLNSDEGSAHPDNLLDCEDDDDDGDGIPDDQDGSPVGDLDPLTPGEQTNLIDFQCGCAPWNLQFICAFGGCNEATLKVVRIIDPDPTKEIIIEQFRVVNQRLFLRPNLGDTPAQLAKAIASVGVGFNAASANAPAPDLRRIEVWSRLDGRHPSALLGVLGEYDANAIALQQLELGTWLALSPATASLPLSLGATWAAGADPAGAASDMDGDGMPDGWEILHGLNLRDPRDAALDSDRDGISNLDEFRSQTSPRDPNSYFKVTDIHREANAVVIEFNTELGRRYQLERTTLERNPLWSGVGVSISGTGFKVRVTDAPSASAYGFYRVRQMRE
jgi:hypothetical protein